MPADDFEKAGHAVVSVAIVCMIPDTELRALVETLLAADAKQLTLEDNYTGEQYFVVRTRTLTLRLVLACCEGQTNVESAITTQLLLFRHNPRFVFLCGIGGGLKPETCKLGDVVIDSEVVYRRYTKIGPDGNFMPEIVNVPGSHGGGLLAQHFFSTHPHPKMIQSPLNRGALFAIHDEKILSWDYVLDHEPTKTRLLTDLDRKLAVVEMEGAGFFKAVDNYRRNIIERPWRRWKAGGTDAIVVRGISDAAAGKALSDTGPVNHREIAARNAAQTVLLLLEQLTERDFSVTGEAGPSHPVA